jgi:hypothetical protein
VVITLFSSYLIFLLAQRELSKAEAGLAKSQRAYEQMRERVRQDDIVQAEYDREKKLRKETKKAEQLARRRNKHAKNKAKDLAKAEKVSASMWNCFILNTTHSGDREMRKRFAGMRKWRRSRKASQTLRRGDCGLWWIRFPPAATGRAATLPSRPRSPPPCPRQPPIPRRRKKW